MAQMRYLICFFQRQRGLEGSLHIAIFVFLEWDNFVEDNLNPINRWYDKQIFEGVLIAQGNANGFHISTFRDLRF